jgi:acyl transferase domain-containing protein
MVDSLLAVLPSADLENCHVLFAGGIHDAVSASVVATIAAPLTERGVKIALLLGSAYIFSKEAVACGAITAEFQSQALQCLRTTLLETGAGHAVRCAISPFAETFDRETRLLYAAGKSSEEIRNALEQLNLGRLRIATKGIKRSETGAADNDASKLVRVNEREQRGEGMYMLGQVAAIRDSTFTLNDLHREISASATERIARTSEELSHDKETAGVSHSSDIAVIGMSCLFPGCSDLETYWRNILNKVDGITEVPTDRWDWRVYFDSDRRAADRIYSKWGGFIPDIRFDPLQYGMPPSSLSSIEPLQLLVLETVRRALDHAGYASRPFPRDRTSVIFGVGGGIAELGNAYAVRAALPSLFGIDNIPSHALKVLPEWTEDSFPGILLNVVAGRVANRFDLNGVNYTVDAACASSLAAVALACSELESTTSDVVIVGGADTVQNPFAYLAFSKTQALSPRGRCHPFDENADGIVISEGVAALVLKRLRDAERDGDQIYAVIKGVAGSSDGRDKSLTAPRPQGQFLALNRAYSKAGISPATVSLIEAHGTGTRAGDEAELETLIKLWTEAGASIQSCALGSVKSMIGHTKAAAGLAGLIKAILALQRKVLPPTMNVKVPNAKALSTNKSPFYINTEPAPWIHSDSTHPRRAGVSAFGFGGTNFHAVLEEYTGGFLNDQDAPIQEWPYELILLGAESVQQLVQKARELRDDLLRIEAPALRDVAMTLWQGTKQTSGPRAAVVASSIGEFIEQLGWLLSALEKGESCLDHTREVYFTATPLLPGGKLSFLFPGQGSQYPRMLVDLAIHFCEIRRSFELADVSLSDRLPERLSTYIFPPPWFTNTEEQARQQALVRTDIAQPALGASGMGLLHLLAALNVRPDQTAGHSYGEYVALCAAGVLNESLLYSLSEARGRCILECVGPNSGLMAAVAADYHRVSEIVGQIEDVWLSNINSPEQTIISGHERALEQAITRLQEQHVATRLLPVACAFHSPLMVDARESFAAILSGVKLRPPTTQVFSNTSALPYPHEPKAIAALLMDHLTRPVLFWDQINAMYSEGARIFVEVGPRKVLTGLVDQCLRDRVHLALPLDAPGRPALRQFLGALGQLAVHGAPVCLDRLFEGRAAHTLDLSASPAPSRALPRMTWLINGAAARPEPRPIRSEPLPRRVVHGANVDSSQTDSRTAPHKLATVEQNGVPVESTNQGSGNLVGSPAVIAGANSDERSTVVVQFQNVMGRFLETQQRVMLAFLRNSASNGSAFAESSGSSITPSKDSAALVLKENQVAAPPLDLTPHSSSTNGDKADLRATLLEIVSERTGYPLEMLGLDLELEADLGIDSIKRTEIFATLQRTLHLRADGTETTLAEALSTAKTLRSVISLVEETVPSAPDSDSTHSDRETPLTERRVASAPSPNSEASRLVLLSVQMAVVDTSANLSTAETILITDDERGAAKQLASDIRDRGARAVIVRMANSSAVEDDDSYKVDLRDFPAVVNLVEQVQRAHGSISGIVHLLPLRMYGSATDEGPLSWIGNADHDIKTLFHLVKAAATDLASTKTGRPIRILAVSPMLSSVVDSRSRSYSALGGIAGFLKSLALEWPHAQHKAVGVSAELASSAVVSCILAELLSQDKEVEVIYQRDARLVNIATDHPIAQRANPALSLNSTDIILLTGGARGITAEIARELANHSQPHLILVGRSPLPEADEASDTAGVCANAPLKTALIERMRRVGQDPFPRAIEANYSRLLREREIRATIKALTAAGSEVTYIQLDVRDEKGLGDLIDRLYHSYGAITGVIHGAGVIEDKLIASKDVESFYRVVDTKLKSAFTFASKLRPESLKFLVFFSSVAGCFGSPGQCDYAAANAVLNKLAADLDSCWPARVISINWGPWDQVGMASGAAKNHLLARGLQLLEPQHGRAAFIRELQFGKKGDAAVVIGRGQKPELTAISHATLVSESELSSGSSEYSDSLGR